MWTYQAPVADMLHLLTRVLDAPAGWAAQLAGASSTRVSRCSMSATGAW